MLDTYLLNEYVKSVVPQKEDSSEYNGYGYFTGGRMLFDGYQNSLPCYNTIGAVDGDRVTASIRDHLIYITGVLAHKDTETT